MPPTTARQAWLANEWREAVGEDTDVKTVHLLAPQIIEDSALVDEADALTEAAARQTLRGSERKRYELVVSLDEETIDIDLGDEVVFTSDRFGFSAGQQLLVLGVDPNAAKRRLTLTVWG